MANPLGKSKGMRGKNPYINKHKISVNSLIDGLINQTDIIIQILDSGYIEKTRNVELEEKVKSLGKKIIYVFNKSDIVNVDKIKNEEEDKNIVVKVDAYGV